MTNKSRAKEITEQLELQFNETVVTKTDYPGDFNKAVAHLTTDNQVIPGPNPPHITTTIKDGNTFTICNGDHPDAPEGTSSFISSSSDGIKSLIDNKVLSTKALVNSGNAS